MGMERTDYLLERRLKETAPELHRIFSDTGFVLQRILDRYRILFPEFTDHTQLHCVTVIDFCNVLVGPERILEMNADEIYVLLMGAYLHDTGMAVTPKDLKDFKERIDYGDFYETHPDADDADFVREFHHDLSGLFIKKYAELFDIPSERHIQAIVQVSRGHRRTDLFDPVEYPSDFTLDNGNTVCLPYLSALIRLADEIDVAESRNPVLLYDLEAIVDHRSLLEHLKTKGIKSLVTTDDAFTLVVDDEPKDIMDEIEEMRKKMQKTLDYCRDVTEKRTSFRITQQRVDIKNLT
ncbi:MAG: hypothetical protein J5966_08695 [Lachnospiraceae bacterium]|nr:hypothetical protein [Lachnospiraceae bacterium]